MTSNCIITRPRGKSAARVRSVKMMADSGGRGCAAGGTLWRTGVVMRVVHVVSSLSAEAGGVARAVMDSAYAMVRDGGDQAEIVAYEGGTHDFPWGEAAPAGLTVTMVKSGRWRHLANGAMRGAIRGALERAGARAEVMHLHGMWEPLMDFAAKVAQRMGVPYVCSIHGMLDPWSMGQRWMRKRIYHAVVEKRRLEDAAALHFTTAAEMKKSSRWVPEGVKLVVVPVIVDLGMYRELPGREAVKKLAAARWGIPEAARCVLFLSRIHEKKGLDILIDAMREIGEAPHLIVAGTGEAGYADAMRQRARERLDGRAHFVGLVHGEEKVALYRRAEVMAVPSSQENFGIVFAESLACETPVILTEEVDIFEEVVRAGAGVVAEREAEDVAREVEALLAQPEKAREMGKAGRQWVLRALDPEAIVRQWREVYGWAVERTAAR